MAAAMPDEHDKPEGGSKAPEDATRPADESGFVPTAPETDVRSTDEEDDDAGERPTVAPPFDPEEFAREHQLLRPSRPIPQVRLPRTDPHTIITPPLGLEAQQAREPDGGAARAPGRTAWGPARGETSGGEGPSRKKTPPGLGTPPPTGGIRRPTPTSTISLANMAVPSMLPPRVPSPAVPKRAESVSSLNAVDSGWAEIEQATRPPPPMTEDSPDEDPVLEILGDRPPVLDDDDDLDEDDDEPAETVRRPVPAEVLANVRAAAPTAPPAAKLSATPTPPQPSVKPPPTEREMNDRVSLGDYSGALAIAEELLATDPGNAVARECAERCRGVLKQMYATRIGPLDRVPVVMVPRDQLRWLSIDHRAGFVLSLVDGVSTLEMIIDVSGMPELDTLRILSELAQQRIISLR